MNKHILFSACTLAACCMNTLSASNPMAGTWHGKINFGSNHLSIVFHIAEPDSEANLPVITLDSPDQGATGIPTEVSHFSADSLSVSVPRLYLQYSGSLRADSICGTFRQGVYSIPLTLQRGDITLQRPQTPRPPFPYSTREVTYPGTQANVQLAATLTLPPNADSLTPVVLMVSGSGLQNRDEEIYGHKPFALLADRLARAGIASLRYDDRGAALSTGDPTEATTQDFASDALAGMHWLNEQGYTNVGILGHSEGGEIAFMLAADTHSSPQFIVTMGAPAKEGREILLAQFLHQAQSAGLNPQECKSIENLLTRLFATITGNPTLGSAQMQALIADSLHADTQQYTSASTNERIWLKSLANSDIATILSTPWMRYFLADSPSLYIQKVKIPALALYGGKDTQVKASENAPLITLLNPGITVKTYDSLNHLMQPCTTGNSDEYAKIETTIDESVIAEIIKFINSLTLTPN